MNLYTYFKFNFNFDIWINVPAADGATSSYVLYKTDEVGLLVPGVSQTYMYTAEQLPYISNIRNVKDAKGNLIFAEFGIDQTRYVTSGEPIFDYQGTLNGYRNTLRRDLPYSPTGGSH